jgi:molecular chaperone IbpA
MARHSIDFFANNVKGVFDHFDRTFPSTVGFDRAFDILNHAAAVTRTNDNFPPYSLIKKDDYTYELEMAVAGFSEADLEIVSSKNRLSVVGMKPEKDEREYIVKGIAGRSFAREFVLADTIVVRDVVLNDGILTIELENVIPEEQKPRKIPIGRQPVEQKAELLVEEK